MNLVFLPEAVDDIDRLFDFLLPLDPIAAQKAMLAIDEGVALLVDNPHLGTELTERPDYRELYVPFGKSTYVLRYRLREEIDQLVVVRVWYGREQRSS